MTEYENATTPMPAMPPDQTGASESDSGSSGQASMSERASGAVGQGKQAAGDVASTAADKAREVKDETARQARDLLGEARGHLSQQVGDQHRNAVGSLRSLSEELGSMHAEQPGLATELVSQARDRVDGLASWLEQREPGDLVGEVRDFARRRPGIFLIGAAVAGVAVGRLTRGAVAVHSDDSDGGDSGAYYGGSAELTGGYEQPADDLYGVGTAPTTPHDPAHAFEVPSETTPGYSSPTYPASGGGYGGPQ